MRSAPDDEVLRERISSNESIALWGGLAVIFGLILEVILAVVFPKGTSVADRWGSVMADALVAIGVFVEIFFAHRARTLSETLQHLSEERVAEANKMAAQAAKEAAQARERTAEVEKLTAWRRIAPELRDRLIAVFKEKTSILSLAVEYEIGDPEAYSFAREIVILFKELGVAEPAFRSNAHIGQTAFGVTIWVGTDEQSAEISALCMAAFGFEPNARDLKEHARIWGENAPNLYFFVGPKPPPEVIMPSGGAST